MPHFQKIDQIEIDDNALVRAKQAGAQIEMKRFEKPIYDIGQHRRQKGGASVKILKNGRSTKPKKDKKGKSTFRSISSVKNSLRDMEDLMRCNFTGGKNEFFITLTYEKKLNKPSKSYLDIRKFMTKMEAAMSDCDLKYICKYELGRQHGWHMHMVLSLNSQVLYTANVLMKIVRKCWPHGKQIDVSKVSNLDGLCYYLAEIKKPSKQYIDYKKELKQGEAIANKWNSYAKYELSQYYPVKCRVFTSSQKLKKPKKEAMTRKEHKKMVSNLTVKKADCVAIINENSGEVLNIFSKEIHTP